MSWLLKGILCLGVLPGLNHAAPQAMDAAGDTTSEDASRIKVLLFDFVPLPGAMQSRMQDRVSGIFAKAGLELAWGACSTGEGKAHLFPDCKGYEDPARVLLRIHPHVRKGLKPEVVAEAIQPARIVNVYWDRVQSEAIGLRVPAPQLLAHVVAHELGHLLLGPDAHAPAGMMAARWRSRDLISISQGGLAFTSEECEKIKAGIRMRRALRTRTASAPTPKD